MGDVGVFLVAAETRPNVLIIYTDEHHFNTLGCYGGTLVGTPHIDSIANSGARCTSFYAATPVCSPSRASLLTGRYPQNTDVVQNNLVLSASAPTLGELLQTAGYRTGWAGKWHLDGDGKPQWQPKRARGFEDNRFMYNRGHWKMLKDTPDGPRVAAVDKQGRPSYGLANADERNYATDWLTTKAIEFIETESDQPFCYVLSLADPHGPNRVRAPYDTQYVGIDIPIPRSLTKPASAVPAWSPKVLKINPKWLRATLPQYYGMVKCIDDNVGRLLTVLRRRGLSENTLVVFTSDHGDLCGEHGRSEKGVPYEGSARIPFLFSLPGVVPAGLKIDVALNTADFLPTVLPLLGLETPEAVDGRNASELFRGETAPGWRDLTFLRGTTGNRWVAAVTDRYKLVVHATEKPWFFDLHEDADEIENRFDRVRYRDTIQGLFSELENYHRRVGDPFLDRISLAPEWE